MTEKISFQQFSEADGVEDWRALAKGVSAHFRTGTFAMGVQLVDVIGRLADDANHHPDVDLRYPGVTVHLMTHDVDGLSERDVALAREISAAARALGVPSDPAVFDDHVSNDVIVDDHGRPEPPVAADEAATLLGFLDYQRATFAWKCAGLDAAGLRVTVAASTMDLGGMMKHLTVVEDYWFSQWLRDREASPSFDAVDWDADPDWEWHSAVEDTPEQLRSLWDDSVVRSRTLTAEALTDGGLDQLSRRAWSDGRSPSLRWILCHMIEEYARHNGHADLIRESLDGMTGE